MSVGGNWEASLGCIFSQSNDHEQCNAVQHHVPARSDKGMQCKVM